MIISRFPPHFGGTELQALTLSKSLQQQGITVEVITQHYRKDLPREETIEGIKVYRLPPTETFPFASTLFLLVAMRWILAQRPLPDIFHAHMISSPSLVAVWAGKFLQRGSLVKPGCSGVYGDIATSQRSFLGQEKLRRVLKGINHLVCISQDIETELIAVNAVAAKMKRIPNGVDIQRFRPAISAEEKGALRKQLQLPSGRLILFTGRLAPQKRPHFLLDAFLECGHDFPDLHLLFLGNGDEEEPLLNRIRQAHLDSRVIVRASQKDVEFYYRCADIFVLPSEAEGLSNSLLEAMASGLPCVASRIFSTVEVMDSGVHGVLFPPYEKDALSHALTTLLENPSLAQTLGMAARKRVEEQFSITSVAQQYIHLYESMLRRP